MTDLRELSPDCVQALARQQGRDSLDRPTAERIAAGAAHAVAAVRASQAGSLFDTDPATYLAELERLADSEETER